MWEIIIKQWTRIIATKPRRAWKGKLKNIDSLLSWMYNKDILNSKEKQTKDSLFRSYYRYYNDGDFPARLRKYDLHKYSNPKQIEEALEKEVEEFITQILSKYAGTYDRSEFNYNTLINKINQAIKSTNLHRDWFSLGSLKSNINEIKSLSNDDEIKSYIEELNQLKDKFENDVKIIVNNNQDKITDKYDRQNRLNYILSATIEKLKEYGLWNEELQSDYVQIAKIVIKIRSKLQNVLKAVEEARNLKLI